ncbi:uncharacterized protein [Ptychodera flava]|uniref:uncharacterized protein n=1 Tax=Ptychodera flava TaxID=63121 RepID=UPI00396A4123
MINKEYLAASGSDILPVLKGEKFKIISVVQEYEFEDPQKLDIAIRAVNDAADLVYDFNKTSTVWKIIGMPPNKGKEIAKKLTRSSRLKITPKIVTTTEELNSELMSSHLVLIPPSTTSYGNLTLAAMCAAIPVVYPEGSHSDEIVSKHIDMLEATECAIDMGEDPQDLKAKIVSVITKKATVFQRAKIIREHIKKKVARDTQGSNECFVTSITADLQETSAYRNDQDTKKDPTVENKGNDDEISVNDSDSTISDGEDENGVEEDGDSTAVPELPTEAAAALSAEHDGNLSDEFVDQASTGNDDEISVNDSDSTISDREDETGVEEDGDSTAVPELPTEAAAALSADEEDNLSDEFVDQASTGNLPPSTEDEPIQVSLPDEGHRIRTSSRFGVTRHTPCRQILPVLEAITALVGEVKGFLLASFFTAFVMIFYFYQFRGVEPRDREQLLLKSKALGDGKGVDISMEKKLSTGSIRREGQIEIKVRPDGIIPKRGKSVREVAAAFYSNKQTKENAVLVGKQLDQRHKHMELHDIGEGSISYIMDCQSSEALESLMDDYSSGSLYRMVKSTFLSESLLDEIGALYLSLGTSIDYEEYLLCQEELEGKDIYHLPIEVIEEMNEEIKSDILREQPTVTMRQQTTRRKATDRDVLQAMSVKQERDRQTELDELMNEWIKIRTELQQLNASHSELVFERQEFVRNTGAIIDEVDIPVEIKQELMMAFQKFLPLGPDKTGKPDQKLVIEGDVLMEYVENIVHDFDIPTKCKQDIIERFSKLVQKRSGKATAKPV